MVAPTIVNAIESGVDPEAACTTLKLCDSAGSILHNMLTIKPVNEMYLKYYLT